MSLEYILIQKQEEIVLQKGETGRMLRGEGGRVGGEGEQRGEARLSLKQNPFLANDRSKFKKRRKKQRPGHWTIEVSSKKGEKSKGRDTGRAKTAVP